MVRPALGFSHFNEWLGLGCRPGFFCHSFTIYSTFTHFSLTSKKMAFAAGGFFWSFVGGRVLNHWHFAVDGSTVAFCG